jgi:hypothetical protein
MRPLRNELLLEAWERGSAETALDRALTMLCAASPDRSREDWVDCSLAERDLALFCLRHLTFGDRLRGGWACGSCATRLEFETSIRSMIERLEASRPVADSKGSIGTVRFTMRPATTRDMAEIASARDPRRELLARCSGAAVIEGCEEAVLEEFNRVNEGAETRLALHCPSCGNTEEADLDIGRFLWSEVRHAARGMLSEVHELASAYGWSERAILEMSPARRTAYLEMALA